MSPAHQQPGEDGYRSGLERNLGQQLDRVEGLDFEYETLIIPYTQPAKDRRYTPDFILPNGIIIEAKGHLQTADRQKHLMVRDSHPDLDIRFVFSRSTNRISKRSKTTYAAWCRSKGFLFADKVIPAKWIREPINMTSLAQINHIRQMRINQGR